MRVLTPIATSQAGLRSLPREPRVRAALRRRGVELEPGADEPRDRYHARLETALMALFRDRRREEDFEALYEYARQPVLSWVLAHLRGGGGRLDPHELLQDVFVNVYRYAGSFRDEHGRSFKGWAQAICRNVVRRRLGRDRRLVFQELPDTVFEPADPRRGPAGSALAREERREWTRAWSLFLMHYADAYRSLGERDRLALELVEVEGLSYAETCERLGVGMSNMKMIMFRARRRIRARMAASMGLDEEAAARAPAPARRLAG